MIRKDNSNRPLYEKVTKISVPLLEEMFPKFYVLAEHNVILTVSQLKNLNRDNWLIVNSHNCDGQANTVVPDHGDQVPCNISEMVKILFWKDVLKTVPG